MLFSVEQAFVWRDEKLAPLKRPVWEAGKLYAIRKKKTHLNKFAFKKSYLKRQSSQMESP